jgi:hypothetical protein
MKPLTKLGRNDLIRIIALTSVVAFPLIADAQLGLGLKAAKLSTDIAPLAVASAKASAAPVDGCAGQHWPYFSAECLRGPARIEPRLVTSNSESAPAQPVTAPSTVVATHAASNRDDAPVAKPKRSLKPKMAVHKRQRSQPGLTFAATPPVGQISLAGW